MRSDSDAESRSTAFSDITYQFFTHHFFTDVEACHIFTFSEVCCCEVEELTGDFVRVVASGFFRDGDTINYGLIFGQWQQSASCHIIHPHVAGSECHIPFAGRNISGEALIFPSVVGRTCGISLIREFAAVVFIVYGDFFHHSPIIAVSRIINTEIWNARTTCGIKGKYVTFGKRHLREDKFTFVNATITQCVVGIIVVINFPRGAHPFIFRHCAGRKCTALKCFVKLAFADDNTAHREHSSIVAVDIDGKVSAMISDNSVVKLHGKDSTFACPHFKGEGCGSNCVGGINSYSTHCKAFGKSDAVYR